MSHTASTYPPTLHVLHQTQLEIRLQPNQSDRNRPFQPGDVLRGTVSLVNPNVEGVQDVKHRLRVREISVKYFWEARSHEPEPSHQTYYRGGLTTSSLLHGSTEDVLLMPGNFGGNALEASWAFEFTIPEKSSITEASLPSPSGRGKSASPSLASIPFSGPPPTFASSSYHVEHILEAAISFVDPSSSDLDSSSSTKELKNERGHRVGGEMESVERTVFTCGSGEEEGVKVGEEERKTISHTVEVGEGGQGGSLQVSLTPPPLPITLPPQSLTLPLNLRRLPPTASPTSSTISAKPKERKNSLFSSFGGGKGKEKKAEEAAAAASRSEVEQQQQLMQQAFTVGSVAGVFTQEGGDGEVVKIALPPSVLNISSSHPTLSSSNGLDTTLQLTFPLPNRFPAEFDPRVGSFQVGIFERKFSLHLTLLLTGPSFDSNLIPLQTFILPSLAQHYLPPPPPTPTAQSLLPPSFDEEGHGFDHTLQLQGLGGQGDENEMPPGIDEHLGGGIGGVGDKPPDFEFVEGAGEGGSGGAGQRAGERHEIGGDLPPSYD